jgi:pyruvate dehydrogenase E2 component (dihydrolipoamide acetyltransferase)
MTATTLHADEMGDGVRTVVFLHGFGGCAGIWNRIARRVATTNRTIAYDLPGHGRSLAFPKAGPAKIAARAVLDDLSARGIEKAHLVGHSMGGAIAALMDMAEPERVASLTLLAPGGFGETINGALLRRYALATKRSEIAECLAAMSGVQSSVTTEAIDVLVAMRRVAGQTEKLVKIAAAIAPNDMQGAISRDRLEKLSMPVTVVWGQDDPMLPYAHAKMLPPGFVVHPLPGIGHMLPEEAADLVVEIIRRATA